MKNNIRKGRRLIALGSGHILNEEKSSPHEDSTIEFRPELHMSAKTARGIFEKAKKESKKRRRSHVDTHAGSLHKSEVLGREPTLRF